MWRGKIAEEIVPGKEDPTVEGKIEQWILSERMEI